jgi:DNA-binding PucR family transcriptional regulator
LGGQVPAPVVATSRGLLVLLLPAGRWSADPTAALRALGSGWSAVMAPAAELPETAAAARDAAASLVVAVRLGLRGRVIPADELLLERALLAAPAQLAIAVGRELGPLEGAPRGAALIETVAAYLAERENIRAAGRRLGVAPRTVAYRLARVERLLGGPLDADRRLRLATALFARRLLASPEAPAPEEPATRPRP